MADQITKTTQSLTTAADMRETTQMLMQPYVNWEGYLTPAPLSIAIMGELVFFSSTCADFSISEDTPDRDFKYIKYPNSFRACLMQVGNSSWHAFNQAHKNMDQIRMHTAAVPDYMKTAVHILFNSSDEVIQRLLPVELDSIRDVAEQCVFLAEGVEQKYLDVIHLIEELLEACTNAGHFHGEELEKVKTKLRNAKLMEEMVRQQKERSKIAMESLGMELEDARDAYKSAMDSIPSGWERIGLELLSSMTSPLTALANAFTYLRSRIGGQSAAAADGADGADGGAALDELAQMKVCSKSEQMLKLTGCLKIFVQEGNLDWKNLYDQTKKTCPMAVWLNDQFNRIYQKLLKLPSEKLREKALSICQDSIYICEQMDTYRPERTWDEKETKDLLGRINKVHEDALKFDSKSKKISGSPALTPKPPMMFRERSSSGQSSASQRASEDARYRIELCREQLKHTRQSYQKSVESMEKNERELTDILCEMQNCNLKEIDFDTTIKMLVKGLDAMGRVKEQWEKMVAFFQMVSNIIKASLSKDLNHFVASCNESKELGYNDKLFTKDLLYNQAFQASNIASLVHMISGTYTQVSSSYLMDRVSSLGRLMAMDKTRPEFLQEHDDLRESCWRAKDEILQLVIKNKGDFERKTSERMEKIERELKAILPAAPPQEAERITEIVQDGFEELEDYC